MKSKINLMDVKLSAVLILLLQLFVLSSFGQAPTDSAVFTSKAWEQPWTVPQGVTSVHIDAYGAQGGGKSGGKGGRVQSDLTVTPGAKLIIYVGSQPTTADAGYNGGGSGCGKGFGGGGATDIRIGGNGPDKRVLVAGGGGGNGYSGKDGDGGGLIGQAGAYDGTGDTANYHAAKGGTQEAAGAGAKAYGAPAGKEGVGGDGTGPQGKCVNEAMGGGGGGYFGGGGSGGGNGGGGSSYTNKDNRNVVHTQGANKGSGKLVIYWVKKKQ